METRRILMRSLAVAVVIASVIWTTSAEDQKMKSCCTKVLTAVVTDPIIDIILQPKSLPCVLAVIFETERGRFCSDPRQRWVREKVKQFFGAQRNKRLTSTPPPTSSISEQTHAGGSTQADAEEVKSCCTKVSTAEVISPIISLRIQRKSLPCVVVIFETKQEMFCSDPRQPLVRRKILEILKNISSSSAQRIQLAETHVE